MCCNLLRKVTSSQEITVAVDEDAAEHRVVRRGYLCHAARCLSFPAGTGDEVVARLRREFIPAEIELIIYSNDCPPQ